MRSALGRNEITARLPSRRKSAARRLEVTRLRRLPHLLGDEIHWTAGKRAAVETEQDAADKPPLLGVLQCTTYTRRQTNKAEESFDHAIGQKDMTERETNPISTDIAA